MTDEEAQALADRLQQLEDVEAIRKLKARYCSFDDGGWDGAGDDPSAWLDLFTEDATFQSPRTGELRGSSAIAKYVGGRSSDRFSVHLAINPNIVVNGDDATGSWHGLVLSTDKVGAAIWIVGRYDERYRRTAEGWRIRAVEFAPASITEFAGDGWSIPPR